MAGTDADEGVGDTPRIGIVGAGITGLALTHHLRKQGIDCITLEEQAEAGGVIDSRVRDGLVLEFGPQRMRLTPGIRELGTTAGLEAGLIEADEDQPLYVYADGRLGEAPMDARTLLRTNLLSWRGKARLLAEPLTSPGDPEETAADLFTRKFGREAYERFIGPLYGGIYGSDPANMPAKYALGGLLEREAETGSLLRAFKQRVGRGSSVPPVSFENGLQALPSALADHYAEQIRFDTPVTAIESEDGQYRLHTPDGLEVVDRIVVTTSAPAASEILEPVATEAAEALASVTYNPLVLVYLRAATHPAGFGYQVGFGADLHHLGCSWNASMFDRDGLYTMFLGGMHEPTWIDADRADIEAVASEEFETVMGVSPEVLGLHRLRPGFPAWDQSWDAISDLQLPDGIDLATNYTARMGIPSRVREARQLAELLGSAE